MEEGSGVCWNVAHPRTMRLDLSPHPYLPWSWLTLVLSTKSQNFLPWGDGRGVVDSHTLRSWGSIEPCSSHVPLLMSFTIHRQTDGTVVGPSCHAPMPGGNWRRGRATSHGQAQAKYLALNRCPKRQIKSDPPLDQEKGQSAFLPEAQVLCPALPIQPASPA